MKMFELPCFDGRKSFYGKAGVIESSNGSKYLRSYETIVASIDPHGKFRRHWRGQSMTTIRHINSFLEFYGVSGGGLKWWNNQKVIPVDLTP